MAQQIYIFRCICTKSGFVYFHTFQGFFPERDVQNNCRSCNWDQNEMKPAAWLKGWQCLYITRLVSVLTYHMDHQEVIFTKTFLVPRL